MAGRMRSGQRMRVVVGAVLLGLLLAGAPGGAAQPGGEASQARGEVEVLVVLQARADLSATTARTARVQAVVQALRATARESQGDLLAFLEARGAEYRPYYVVNAVWVRAGQDLLGELARRPDVAAIAANPHVRGVDLGSEPVPAGAVAPGGAVASVEENLARINADDAWALGYTGEGIVVAGQDTGVAWQHPALVNQYRGWDGTAASHDYNWHDAVHTGGGTCGADSPEPCDDYVSSHGTHTMGIMVGDDGSTRVGVAPGAQWIACRNMDQGIGTPARYLECFEFFLAPYPVGATPDQGDPTLAPHVVNNSWGCPPSEGCDAAAITLLEEAVEALRQAGIVVVASAGNSGSSCGTVSAPPALYQGSLTVGNFDHRTGAIAASSSRGPVTYGGLTYVKPDVTAPGTAIRSSVKGGYASLSGTSMAAPHVAGAAALLLSAGPGLAGDVEAVEELLTRTAEARLDEQCGPAGPPNNVWGWGIVDVLGSIDAGLVRGGVTAEGGLPLQGARVLAEARPPATARAETTTGPTGSYTLALPAGVYDLAVDGTCYGGSTVVVEVLRAQATTIPEVVLSRTPCTYLPLAMH